MKLTTEHAKSSQIADYLRRKIVSGSLRPGEKLEGSRGLAEQFHVGRQVIRSAFKILEKENFIRTAAGSGVFVNDFIPSVGKKRKTRIGFVPWKKVLTEDFELRTYLELLRQAPDKNCEIFLCNTPDEKEFLSWIRNYDLNGVILCGFLDDKLIRMLNAERITFLVLGNYAFSEPANCLEKDVYRNVRDAASILLKRYQFKRIACIFESMFGLGPKQTLQGLKDAAAQNALTFDDSLVFQTSPHYGYEEMEFLFRSKKLGRDDLVYLTEETFAGAARSILERNLPPGKRPYLFLDMPRSTTIPYQDLVGCFLYENNTLTEDALNRFLDICHAKVKTPWRGTVQCEVIIKNTDAVSEI